MTRHEELKFELTLGREIAAEVPGMIREMQCRTCGIGAAIARVEKRHGVHPTFDWQGEAARKASHACVLTIWDKRQVIPMQQPHWSDQGEGDHDAA